MTRAVTPRTKDERAGTLERVLAYADVGFVVVLVGGAYAAALGWRPGIFYMLAAFGGPVVGHVVQGVASYRRVMAAPWPGVRPLSPDEDDW